MTTDPAVDLPTMMSNQHNNDGHHLDDANDASVDNADFLERVDVCVTTISSKPPVLPLREELPSLGVELVYNSKGTGMRGVRRAYREAKRHPPPPPVKKGSARNKLTNQVKRTVRQTKLGRRILRTNSSGSLCSNSSAAAALRVNPKKMALSYETYQRTALRSPGSSVVSSFCGDQSVTTHSTAYSDEDDGSMMDKIDEGAEQEDRDAAHQRRKRWKQLESNNPVLPQDTSSDEPANGGDGLSYNFDSTTSNLPAPSGFQQQQQGQQFATANATANGAAAPTSAAIPHPENASPMQKLEQWSEALRTLCCLGYLNFNHKDAKTNNSSKKNKDDENTAPLLAFSASQDSDMQNLLIKMEDEKIPPGFLPVEGTGKQEDYRMNSGSPAAPTDNISVVAEDEEENIHENQLFALLAHYNTRPEEVKELINNNPDLLSTALADSGRTPLHELCDRGLSLDPWVFLPDGDDDNGAEQQKQGQAGSNTASVGTRSTEKEALADDEAVDEVGDDDSYDANEDTNARRLLNGLLGDITNLRIMIKVVAWANLDACCTKDKNTDLPLHILARRLVEWEKSWNNEDVKYFCDPTDISNSARITTIYRTMAECIEVVLRPVAEQRELCMSGGSCGVLPLHIAALFGTSYDTLRLLLEEYIEGARIPCKVHNSSDDGDSRSSGDFEILPLTLLEQREIEQAHVDAEANVSPSGSFGAGIQWSSSALDSTTGGGDFVAKSDLLFACHPNILPQRKEPARLKRIESMIRSEVIHNHRFSCSHDDSKLTVASESIWLFMCTYTNEEDDDDHYAENVKRIVEGLDSVSLLKLLAITDKDGRELLDVVNPKCGVVIKESLQVAVQDGSASPRYASPSSKVPSITSGDEGRENNGSHPETKSILKNSKVGSRGSKEPRSGTVDVCNEIGRLCKSVFRIKQDNVPTSFIILPYKMKEDAYGNLALASSKDAGLALKFAHSLVKLTDARAILYTLENKFHERRGCPSDSVSGLSQKEKEEIANDIVVFLSLYTSNIGYLYLLDERTGVPQIKNAPDSPSTYPIIISNAYATVDKLLPLMQMGMTLMRGDVALRVLGQVICLGAETVSPRSWVGASQEIVTLMYSANPDLHQTDEDKEKFVKLRDKLLEYASAMSAKVQKDGLGFEDGSEWVVESSFLKTVLEKFDGRRTYAGLKPIKCHGGMIWTTKVEASDQAGEVKAPGEYIDPRFRYDAFIHTSILFHQEEQGSEVSSMTSVFFDESPENDQAQRVDNDDVPSIIQALSAVCEEEMDEKALSPNESDSDKNAVVVPETNEHTTAPAAKAAADVVVSVREVDQDPATDDDYTEETVSSDESTKSDATYSAVLETLGFNMYESSQEEEGDSALAAELTQSADKIDEPGGEATITERPLENAQMEMMTEYNDLDFELSDEEDSRSERSDDGEDSRSAFSLLNEDEEEDAATPGAFSGFCAQEVRDRISSGIDAYRKLHPGIQTIKFVLMEPTKNLVEANSSILGISILDEEENQIDTECLGTADELLSFVRDSIRKEKEIKEKDAQIKDLKNAMMAFDSMKTNEIIEKEVAIRELTRKLRLYEEESYSVASADKHKDDGIPITNSGKVELSMFIRSCYDGDQGMLGTDTEDDASDNITKVQAGMKAHLYDLDHTHISRDIQLEQLRLDWHMREIGIIREKNLEIKSLREKLMDKDIQIQEFEEKITLLTQPALKGDETTASTGSSALT